MSVLAAGQAPTVGPGEIRCPACALTGQKPAPPGFDRAQVTVIPKTTPVFFDGRALQFNLIARVLQGSPLILEVLDSVDQSLDRNMKVVEEDRGAAKDLALCGRPERIKTVDLASQAVVSSLGLNDLVTAVMIMNRDEKNPDSPLDATFVLTKVRKVSGRVTFFHRAPAQEACADRSGRLVVYEGPVDGELTEIYNDGAILYRDAADVTSTRERLSEAELADLLRIFRDVNFDALPPATPHADRTTRPTIALIAARYQNVAIPDTDARLAPLLKRMHEISTKAMSRVDYVLKHGEGAPLKVAPWPNLEAGLDRLADPRARRAADAPDAWRRPLPASFLAGLPESYAPGGPGGDPNRLVYFTDDGKLYRVARGVQCPPGVPCALRDLEVAEVAEPLFGPCTRGTPNCQTTIYSEGRAVHELRDPSLTGISGRLWPKTMGIALAGVPPDGAVISKDEYERHQQIYFPLLLFRATGASYIEAGIVYERVRLEVR